MVDKKNVVAQWAAEMKDGISGPAKDAAEALDQLRDAMKADQSEMAALKKAMANLKGGSGAEVEEQMKALKERFEQKSKAVAAAQSQYIKLGGRFDALKRSGGGFRDMLKELHKGAQQTPGPMGQLASSLTHVMEGAGKARLMIVALAAAFAAASVAAITFLSRLKESAIAAQDARRNEMLHFEALTKMRNLWGIAAGKASEMQAAVDKVSASVSISRGEVASLADQIYKAGARGKNFERILEAASIKSSALGSAAGSAFAGFAQSVAIAGGSAERAANDIKNRFGGVVQAKMKSLEVQALKQKEAFDSLFGGIDIEPLLSAKKALGDMFAQSTVAGRALKTIMTLVLQPLIDASTTALVVMRRFYKQMIIGGQELIIAWLTVRVWFKRTFGGPETESVLKKFFDKVQWGRVVVYMLATAFTVLAGAILVKAVTAFTVLSVTIISKAVVAFGSLAVSVLAATWPFLLAAAAVWGLYSIISNLYDLWKEIDWGALGTAVIDGIVNGIKNGWTSLKEMVSATGDAMTGWFKSVLGIASPSKVFAELGLAIPQGIEQGVKSGQSGVQSATQQVVKPPAAVATGGGTRGNVSVTIAELHVHAAGSDAKSFAESTRRELENILAGLAVQIGAPAR